MNKAQKYANSKNPQSTSEAKSLLRGYHVSRELNDFDKAVKRMNEYKAKKKDLAEAVCGYIMVATEDFVFKVVEMIEREEKSNK